MIYRLTIMGGLKPPERWDYFDCLADGPFEYRERTRTFRRTKVSPTS
jgi:hypothetical protein